MTGRQSCVGSAKLNFRLSFSEIVGNAGFWDSLGDDIYIFNVESLNKIIFKVRKVKEAAKKARIAENEAKRRAEKEQKKEEEKDCAFYAEGYEMGGAGLGIEYRNRCKPGMGQKCTRLHSPAVSKRNVARWKAKNQNAAKGMPGHGGKKIMPTSIRTGTIIKLGPNGDFGWIVPDAQEIHSNRKKQWLFFHMRSWIGKVDTKPTESTWYNMRVRYVRVVDDRNHGKWAAINVSKL